ncbi:MAG: nucleotide pyrophosphohydrolase [Erysipelotrichaceae bacterium]|nr:nucleotide pyrophosphohydrolase [Erysipelotrichaceae bacterium]MDD3923955.1 nucleotide pyrophosphohydrolase [Erysipelotrichaceae bacterium]MDD4642225.1 nucleotide pyrophosphohydrolase [Erysipelotrichaceae bacterium]
MQDINDLKQLQTMVRTFCDKRNWKQFHNPKDLAIGMSVEANELLDLFRFKQNEELDAVLQNKKEAIANEISDVFFYLLRFSDLYDIDLFDAFLNKLKINEQHYPVDKAKNNNNKYNDL